MRRYSTPAVIGNRSTNLYLDFLEYFKIDLWERMLDHKTRGRKTRSWMADGVLLLSLAWCVWKLLRPANSREMDEAPEQGAAASDAPTQDAPANWRNVIYQHIRQWAQNCIHHSQNIQDTLVALRAWVNLWAENLIWLDGPPLVQVSTAVAYWIICMYLAFHLLEWVLVTALVALVKWEEDSQTTAPPSGYTLSSPTCTSAAVHASDNAFTTVLNCLWQIKHCITSVFQAHLDPDSSHDTFDAPSSRTGALYKWTAYMVMSFKSMRLAIANPVLGDIKRCHDAAWANPMSPSGTYDPALHFGRTASLCSAIEWIVMSGRIFKQLSVPCSALLDPVMAPVRRFLGCLPWILRISGSLYPLWVHQVNSEIFHIITPILLATVFTLNTFAIARWPAPRTTVTRLTVGKIAAIFTIVQLQRSFPLVPIIAFYSPVLQPPSRLMLLKRLALKACLLLAPMALLVWFLQLKPYPAGANFVFITSTAVILCCCRELVEPKWNAVLQWLRLAPWI